jgi:phosphatidylglycerophosphate synthase
MKKTCILLLAGIFLVAPTAKAETEAIKGRYTPEAAINFLIRLDAHRTYALKQHLQGNNQTLNPEKWKKTKKNAQWNKQNGKTWTGKAWFWSGFGLLLLSFLLLIVASYYENYIIVLLILVPLILSVYFFIRSFIYWINNPRVHQDNLSRSGNVTLVFGMLAMALLLLGLLFVKGVTNTFIPWIVVILSLLAIIAGIVQLTHTPDADDVRDRLKIIAGLVMGVIAIVILRQL